MHQNDSGDLKALLNDDRVSIDVKRKILSDASFNPDEASILIELIENNTELADISLKKLSFINRQRAFELSQDILNNRTDESRVKISEALKATAHYLKDNQDLPNVEELEADFFAQTSGTDVCAKSELQSKKRILSIIDVRFMHGEPGVLSFQDSAQYRERGLKFTLSKSLNFYKFT
ncbi:hypothetical protein [Exiguobacterium algae]|uniref:hypothetical protein n=1 Tax=Exiguobacterium algae TaxID=2751250 RepID=UPI001BED1261|nr:hypothetical protein [Exiguobacterium algae]